MFLSLLNILLPTFNFGTIQPRGRAQHQDGSHNPCSSTFMHMHELFTNFRQCTLHGVNRFGKRGIKRELHEVWVVTEFYENVLEIFSMSTSSFFSFFDKFFFFFCLLHFLLLRGKKVNFINMTLPPSLLAVIQCLHSAEA